jgi:peptide/nickel transport system ATP-binding protein
MTLLQVKNLVVEFTNRHGTLRALDHVSFDIAAWRNPGRGR